MSRVNVPLPQPRSLAETSRQDRWWVQPLAVFLGLTAFLVYANWAAFQASNFFASAAHPTVSLFGGAKSVAHYLSPMYSPVLYDIPGMPSGHAWFGEAPSWLVSLWDFIPGSYSPAFLILIFPAGFRLTCYYYRGAYYKAFWGDPLNCAVGEPGFRGKKYRGEAKLPLILMNIHRYFLYAALVFILILSYDALISYWFTNPDTGKGSFGIGVGSLILTINPILLGGYTLGCHSLRHLVGGQKDCIGAKGLRRTSYECVSCLNRGHMKWAWFSLVWVGFTDFYVRMVASGAWTDYRLF